MIGDIKIPKPIHKTKAKDITSIICDDYFKLPASLYPNYKKIYSIGGESGTGKTEITEELQKLLFQYHLRTLIIHIDDYYKTSWHNRDDIRKETGIIGKDEVNWHKLNSVIHDYENGKSKLYIQMIHRFLDEIIHMIVPTKNIDAILIEGLYGCYVKQAKLSFYLEGSYDDTYEFRKERGKEDPDNDFRKIVLEKERKCVVQSKQYATYTLPFN